MSQDKEREALPCPFCGGKAHRRKETLDERFAYADRVSYGCAVCGFSLGARGDTSKGGYADNSTVEKRALAAWNTRAALASQQAVKGEPVAAQHRFRHPQKGTPDWSEWQQCKVSSRPPWEIDSVGYEVEYRNLYASPPSREPLTDEALGIAMTNSYYDAASFIAGVRFAERHHGIHSREGGSNEH